MPTWAANSRARLSRDELHQLRWLLGLVLVLLAFWTLFGLEIGGIAWRAAFFLTAASAFIWPAWPGHIPDWIRYWSLVLGGGALLTEIIATRFDVLSGLVLMISLLTLSRGLQYRRLREDWQLVLLCLFIIVLSGVLTLDILFGLQILLFTVFTMALLFVMNLLERDAGRALTRDDWRNFRWRQFAGRVWHALDLRQVLQAAALFTGLVLVGTLIFVAMPRYQFEQSFNFGGVKGLAGFHENIMYLEKWSLADDDTVAFRVDPPPNFHLTTTPYWRMVVLDAYIDGSSLDDTGFIQSNPWRDQKNHDFRRLYQYPGPDDVNKRPLRTDAAPVPGTWKFYLEGNISEYLPILGTFDQLNFSSTQSFFAREDMQVYRIEQTSPKVLGYEIENMTMDDEMPVALDAMPQGFTLANADATRAHGHALQYPYTYFSLPKDAEDRKILDNIVAQIKGSRTNMPLSDFKNAAEDYLRENHPTSMSVDLSGYTGAAHDLLIRWLDTPNSPGWCEYFAGAFVLLARDAGYPARVVVGYKGAVYNSVENYYSVLQSDAHAWAEILDSQSRWIRVDPTPGGEASPGDTLSGGASGDIIPARGWSAYLDSLRMIWYRRVINFDQSDQAQMVDTLEQYTQAQAHDVALWFSTGWQKVVAWFRAPLSKTRVFVLGLLLAAAVLAWWRAADLRNAWLRLSGNRWLGRMRRLSPVRLSAGRWLRRFEPVWLAHSADLPPAERTEWSMIRGELLALRYGPPNPSANPAQTFRQARMLLRKKHSTAKVL